MHVWKNAQMTRTNKIIKQGNTCTRKIKNDNNTTVVPEGVIPKYTSDFYLFVSELVQVIQCT